MKNYNTPNAELVTLGTLDVIALSSAPKIPGIGDDDSKVDFEN